VIPTQVCPAPQPVPEPVPLPDPSPTNMTGGGKRLNSSAFWRGGQLETDSEGIQWIHPLYENAGAGAGWGEGG
jgi:hypothetical protein